MLFVFWISNFLKLANRSNCQFVS